MTDEGKIPFKGFQTWYRVVGEAEDPGKLPLLTLHGGPGASSDYLEPYGRLAETGRSVIFYDQLGGGRSAIADRPHDPRMWTIDLYLDEVRTVREALGLDRVHLLGQSWGGMLAMEYALTEPAGLASLIVQSAPAGVPQWIAEARRLLRELPPELQETIARHEAEGTTNHPEYQEAMAAYYDLHVCRVKPMPDCVRRTFDALVATPEVYGYMQGPSEFHVTGTIKDWDITGRLGEVRVPTLVMSGRHDEATPAIAETVHRGILGSEWIVFEESSHMAHVEQTEEVLKAVAEFLGRVESRIEQ